MYMFCFIAAAEQVPLNDIQRTVCVSGCIDVTESMELCVSVGALMLQSAGNCVCQWVHRCYREHGTVCVSGCTDVTESMELCVSVGASMLQSAGNCVCQGVHLCYREHGTVYVSGCIDVTESMELYMCVSVGASMSQRAYATYNGASLL